MIKVSVRTKVRVRIKVTSSVMNSGSNILEPFVGT